MRLQEQLTKCNDEVKRQSCVISSLVQALYPHLDWTPEREQLTTFSSFWTQYAHIPRHDKQKPLFAHRIRYSHIQPHVGLYKYMVLTLDEILKHPRGYMSNEFFFDIAKLDTMRGYHR